MTPINRPKDPVLELLRELTPKCLWEEFPHNLEVTEHLLFKGYWRDSHRKLWGYEKLMDMRLVVGLINDDPLLPLIFLFARIQDRNARPADPPKFVLTKYGHTICHAIANEINNLEVAA